MAKEELKQKAEEFAITYGIGDNFNVSEFIDFAVKFATEETKELEAEKKLNAEIKARFVKCNTCTDEMKSKCLMFSENLCEGERCEELVDLMGLISKSELERENLKAKQACHKWFMRWREAKKDALYFDSSLQKQIESTLKLQQENAGLKDYNKKLLQSDIDKQNKIVLLSKKVNDLQKEYAELKKKKEEIEIMTNFCKACKKMHTDNLTKAKEIIKKLYSHFFQGMGFMELNDYNVQKAEVEQFISEVEK